MYQMILENEYGDRNILFSSKDFQEVVAKAKEYVSSENTGNALTISEQKRNFTCYFVEFVNENDEIAENVVYSGRKGPERVCLVLDDTEKYVNLDEITELKPRFYLGEFSKDKNNNQVEYFYLEDQKGNVINKMGHQMLQDKSLVIIRKAL